MEELIWDLINKELKDRNIISAKQQSCMENGSCQINQILFLGEITALVAKDHYH